MVYRILRRQNVEADRVTGLVVRGQALVVLIDDVALLLHAHYNLEQRLLDLLLRDQLLVAACRKQRCLIEQVFEVCTGETGGRLGNFRELDIRVELLVAGMYLEDSLTALDIRCADIDLTIKATRTQQRVIQNILAVGGCDDDNAARGTPAQTAFRAAVPAGGYDCGAENRSDSALPLPDCSTRHAGFPHRR